MQQKDRGLILHCSNPEAHCPSPFSPSSPGSLPLSLTSLCPSQALPGSPLPFSSCQTAWPPALLVPGWVLLSMTSTPDAQEDVLWTQ